MNLDVVYNLINLNSTLDALGIYTETILGAVLSASLSLKSTLLSAHFLLEYIPNFGVLAKIRRDNYGSIYQAEHPKGDRGAEVICREA
ncbi:unnamed protein product [Hermetia illucens]|uniref:Uncharacterized protein n=1 Tax=Hermetia illucens TaxID=343691 RepID=A0A7R8UAT5_HERIL|nr:unnamed protein product [Hermetia illucens]